MRSHIKKTAERDPGVEVMKGQALAQSEDELSNCWNCPEIQDSGQFAVTMRV